MGGFIDLTGKRFNRLLVIKRGENKYTPSGHPEIMWDCICDCGNEKSIRSSCLRNGLTTSCGCLFIEMLKNTTRKKINKYNLSGYYGIGYTLKREEFYFDLEDYNKIKNHCWYKNNDGYIRTFIYSNKVKTKHKNISLHRFLMMNSLRYDMYVDHINHCRNDNRKNNLRMVTYQQSNMNNGLRKDNKSNTTGVYWNDKNKIWQAQIRINKKAIHLGCFNDKNKAIEVRKRAEEKYFGEYSHDNSIKKVGVINDKN